MGSIALLTLLLGGVAVTCLLVLLSQLSSLGAQSEEPVGPMEATRPEAPPPALVPGNLRTLIGGESARWKREHSWTQLVTLLDDIERRLGGTPPSELPPEEYSAAWLDQRVARIEAVAGPLPSPMRPLALQPTKPRRWKRT